MTFAETPALASREAKALKIPISREARGRRSAASTLEPITEPAVGYHSSMGEVIVKRVVGARR